MTGLRSIALALLCLCPLLVRGADPDEIAGLRYRAQRAASEERYAEAVHHFRELRRIADSESVLVEASVGLIKNLFILKNHKDALLVAKQVPIDFKKLPKAQMAPGLGLVAANKQKIDYWRGRVLLAQGKHDLAATALKRAAASKDPQINVMSKYYLGTSQLFKGTFGLARETFGALAKEGQSEQSQATQAGRVGLLIADFTQAKWDEFDRGFEKWSPNTLGNWDVELTLLRIRSFLKRKRSVDALKFYREKFLDVNLEHLSVVERGHLKADHHYQTVKSIGSALVERGEYRKAREFYVSLKPRLPYDRQRQEIQIDMANGAYRAMLSLRAAQKAEEAKLWYSLATDDLSRFLKSYKKSELTAKVYYYQGQLLKADNEIEKAIRSFTEAYRHKRAPADTKFEAAMQLAVYHQGKKALDKALDWYQNAADQKVAAELRARAHYERGVIFDSLKKYVDATQVFGLIVQSFPELPIVHNARFNQANTAYKSGTYKDACKHFKTYLEKAPPGHGTRTRALYTYGVALSQAGEYAESKTQLLKLVKDYPTHPLAPKALLEAVETARAAALEPEQLVLSTRVLKEYPETPEVARALYNRIYYFLYLVGTEADGSLSQEVLRKTLEDEKRFFDPKKDYAKKNPSLAAQILLWIGDYFFNRGQYQKSERYFLKVATDLTETDEMPEALYEAAKSAYYQHKNDNNFGPSLLHLKQLEALPKTRLKEKRILSQAYLLHGDILSVQAKYQEAEAFFKRCAEQEEVSVLLKYQAIGRMGDMKHARALDAKDVREKDTLLNESAKCYTDIIEFCKKNDFYPQMMNKARFHRGLVRLLQKNETEALADFQSIFEAFMVDRLRERKSDWFFFVKSGIILAEHYTRNDQLQKAVDDYYRVIAKAGISFSPWAAQKAEALQKELDTSKSLDDAKRDAAPKPETPAKPGAK